MSTDKTLADAQPGGRVRLGGELPPLPYPNYPVSKTGLQNNAYTASQMWDYAIAALSAQPSPGETLPPDMRLGSADYLDYLDSKPSPGGQEWPFVESPGEFTIRLHAAMCEFDLLGAVRHVLIENPPTLTARQPVGEIDEAAVLRRAAAVLYMWEDDPNLTGYMGDFNDACGILELLAQHAAPTAQAVDLPAFKALYRAYVRLLESGRDRIIDLGGTCDPVDVMEANDVDLQAARRVLDSQAVGK